MKREKDHQGPSNPGILDRLGSVKNALHAVSDDIEGMLTRPTRAAAEPEIPVLNDVVSAAAEPAPEPEKRALCNETPVGAVQLPTESPAASYTPAHRSRPVQRSSLVAFPADPRSSAAAEATKHTKASAAQHRMARPK